MMGDGNVRNAPAPPPPPAPPPNLSSAAREPQAGSTPAGRCAPARPSRPPPSAPPPLVPPPPPPHLGRSGALAGAAGAAAQHPAGSSEIENAQRLLHDARGYETPGPASHGESDSVPLVFDSLQQQRAQGAALQAPVHVSQVQGSGAPPTPPPQWPPEGSLIRRLTKQGADEWDTDDVNSVDGEESECVAIGEAEAGRAQRALGAEEDGEEEGTVEAVPRGAVAAAGASVQSSQTSGGGGWQAYFDADGDVYFHHTETGVSQWERPEGFEGMPDESVVASEHASLARELGTSDDQDDEVVL
jgi:hypothetical protein